jgi:hypothetical protein
MKTESFFLYFDFSIIVVVLAFVSTLDAVVFKRTFERDRVSPERELTGRTVVEFQPVIIPTLRVVELLSAV